MSIFFPEAVKVQGNTKVVLATAVANTAAPSLASEVNAASSVDASMTFRAWNPTTTVNTGNAPARLATTVQLPVEGNAQLTPITVNYPYDPTVDDTDPNNAAKALCARGVELYAIVRKGVDAETPMAVGDLVDVWHVSCGYQQEQQTGDDEFAEYEIQQNLIPLGPKVDGVIAA